MFVQKLENETSLTLEEMEMTTGGCKDRFMIEWAWLYIMSGCWECAFETIDFCDAKGW